MQHNLQEAMRLGMRRLASGVSVIATQNAQDQRFAMTASSVTSLSDAPPSLLVCVNKTAQMARELALGCTFSVNVLSRQQEEISILCAGVAVGEKRFDAGDWQSRNGTPVLMQSEVNFVCEVDAIWPYGTHNVIVGKISDVYPSGEAINPLVYLDGSYRELQ